MYYGVGGIAGEPLSSLLVSIIHRCQVPVNHKRFYSERKIDSLRLWSGDEGGD